MDFSERIARREAGYRAVTAYLTLPADQSRWPGERDHDHTDPPVETRRARVGIIDRHLISREGLAAVLAADPFVVVAGITDSPENAVNGWATRPDVVLLGTHQNLAVDLAAVHDLMNRMPEANGRILLLRRTTTNREATEALAGGVRGCVAPDIGAAQLGLAIRIVFDGGVVFSPAPPRGERAIATPLTHTAEVPPDQANLTDRERMVLSLLAQGMSNSDMARELFLAEATVKKYLAQAMRKIDQPDRLRAGLYSYRHGM